MGCHPKAISDLGPGQCAKVTQTGIQITQYYDAPLAKRAISRADAARKVFELVGEGASERVMSDVPVCTLLSGGIDSAAVAYWLKRSIPNLRRLQRLSLVQSLPICEARELPPRPWGLSCAK